MAETEGKHYHGVDIPQTILKLDTRFFDLFLIKMAVGL
jgi:hypothetical protein